MDGYGRLQWSDNVAVDSPEYCARVSFKDAEGMCGGLMSLAGSSAEHDDRQQTPRNIFEFNIADLPPGSVDLTVALDTGFYTTNSDPIAVIVPAQPIIIQLIEPAAAFAGKPSPKLLMSASARAFCGSWGGINDRTAFKWAIDGEPVGSGPFLLFDPPPIGHHVATVVVHWRTERLSASVNFEVTSQLLADANAYCTEFK